MTVPWSLVFLAGVVTVGAYVIVERYVRQFLRRVRDPNPNTSEQFERHTRHRRLAPMVAGLFVALMLLSQLVSWSRRQPPPPNPPGASVSSKELRELRTAVNQCCGRQWRSGSGGFSGTSTFDGEPPLPEPEVFGLTGGEIAIILTASFGGLAFIVLTRGHKKTAAALFAASTLFGMTGTKLFSLDKAVSLDKVDKLFGVHINTASLLGPEPTRAAVNPEVTVEEAEITAFETGNDDLPTIGMAVPPSFRTRSPLLLVLVGRADRRELRGEFRARHGTNPRLAERRARRVSQELWPNVRVVVLTAPPRIENMKATEAEMAPDRSVKIYAFFAK